MESVILAGGFGTRLRDAIGEYPKCMAPVNGKPFLHYMFSYLQQQGCRRVVLSLGYKFEIITSWLREHKWPFEVAYVIENEPLGTGGGMQLALQETKDDNVAVLNGDTMFQVNLRDMFDFHIDNGACTSLALKEMQNFDRYGVVNQDSEHHIVSFEEKKARAQGFINGGVYIINRNYLLEKDLPERFSFEKDYLEEFVDEGKFFAYKSDAYFIDIGIPGDYEQAQTDFKTLFE